MNRVQFLITFVFGAWSGIVFLKMDNLLVGVLIYSLLYALTRILVLNLIPIFGSSEDNPDG